MLRALCGYDVRAPAHSGRQSNLSLESPYQVILMFQSRSLTKLLLTVPLSRRAF